MLVRKAGDIIPEVIRPLAEKRTGAERRFIMPRTCPSCGEPAIREEGEAAVRCTNPSCPAQLERTITHFASRGAMDIEGMGESTVRALIGASLIADAADIYSLDREDIARLDGFGEKSASNLIAAIEASKSTPPAGFIYALGIRHVGEGKRRSCLRTGSGRRPRLPARSSNSFALSMRSGRRSRRR